MHDFCTRCGVATLLESAGEPLRPKRGRSVEAPLDALLGALLRWRPRSYRCTSDPTRWLATCPACKHLEALDVHEPVRDGAVNLTCLTGCAPAEIARRLAHPELVALDELRADHERLRMAYDQVARQLAELRQHASARPRPSA